MYSLAGSYSRFEYRKIQVYLKGQSHWMSAEPMRPPVAAGRLVVGWPPGGRGRRSRPASINVWAYDFVHTVRASFRQ